MRLNKNEVDRKKIAELYSFSKSATTTTLIAYLSCQNATALAAATFKESTP